MYRVQYTDKARSQMEDLDSELGEDFPDRIRTVVVSDPHAHGAATKDIHDRRRVMVGDISVYFWVSREVDVVTVFDVTPVKPTDQGSTPPGPEPDGGGDSGGASAEVHDLSILQGRQGEDALAS